jgi:hypothetical protein
VIKELDRVRLKADTETPSGVIPAGSKGTVVHLHATPPFVMVEFPGGVVETMDATTLDLIEEAAS